jgi:hypothetical protein
LRRGLYGYTKAKAAKRADGKAPLPEIRVNDVMINEDTGVVTFQVTLDNASMQNITVNYATANDTATLSDQDYTGKTGTLTFASGETTKTISIVITSDLKSEADETFTLNLTSPTNATIADNQGVATVLSDDPPVVTVTANGPATEGGVMEFTFHRTGDLSNVQLIDFGYFDSSTNEVDFTWAGNNGNPPRFEAGSDTYVHRLTTFNDGLAEGSENVGVYLVNNYGYTVGGSGTAEAPLYDPPVVQALSEGLFAV